MNGVPVDLSFACHPTGHVAAEDRAPVEVSADVTRKALIGSFGCPQSRTEAESPAPR